MTAHQSLQGVQILRQHYLDMDYIASRHLAALHVLMIHQRLRSTNVQTLCILECKAACAQKVVEQATGKEVERPCYRLQGVSWHQQLGAHKPKLPACANAQTTAALKSFEAWDMPFASCIAGNKTHAYKPSATLGNSPSCMRNMRKASVYLSTQQITELYLHVGRRYIELLLQSIWQTLQYALLLLLLLSGLVQLLLLHGLVVL